MGIGRTPKPGNRVDATCPACGKAFWHYRSAPKRYCSRACQKSDPATHVDATCPTCGGSFRYLKSWPRKYCSLACASTANIGNIPTHRPSAFTAVCDQCGAEYRATPATSGRFCSRACFGAWQSANRRGEAHPSFGKKRPRGKTLLPVVCPVCGKTFGVKPCAVGRRVCCSKSCLGKHLAILSAGENNPNWLGGHNPYYGPSWREARRRVLAAARFCADCGLSAEAHGRSFDVHHVVPFRAFGVDRHAEANAIGNLVALCKECHTRREWADNRRSSHELAP